MKKNLLLFFVVAISVVNGKINFNSFERIKDISKGKSFEKNWAVLVAGSNTYSNYRHQANVLHAYQLLQKKHGIPKDQIILMMYDDIAYNENNPFKGNIINVPDGENLYADDIVKDYTGEDVTPKNFMKVLLGDEELKKSGKKILESNENDHIFIYFTDHGAPGLVGFPSQYLYASQLMKTLEEMKSKKMFKKLIFYLEACESGSMFEGLLKDNLDIYAVSSTNPDEPGYAKFLDQKRSIYLTDEFSISWLLNAEENDKKKNDELLRQHIEIVKKLTESSHVNQYGDLKIADQYHISEFIGKPISNNILSNFSYLNYLEGNKINSREAEYYSTKLLSEKYNDNKFGNLQKNRNITLNFINQLTSKLSQTLNVDNYSLTKKSKIENRDCYEQFVDLFNDHCASITKHTYLLRHLHIFVNTCNIIQKNEQQNIVSVDSLELKKSVKKYCKLYKNSFSEIPNVV